MAMQRRALHAYVSDTAHDQWHNVAVEWGVSVSALLEALAPVLSEHESSQSTEATEQIAVVRSARSIDAKRRRRSRA